jgi:hypothetical protein
MGLTHRNSAPGLTETVGLAPNRDHEATGHVPSSSVRERAQVFILIGRFAPVVTV